MSAAQDRELIGRRKVSPKGQISLPREVMAKVGIQPGDAIHVARVGRRILILTEEEVRDLLEGSL